MRLNKYYFTKFWLYVNRFSKMEYKWTFFLLPCSEIFQKMEAYVTKRGYKKYPLFYSVTLCKRLL